MTMKINGQVHYIKEIIQRSKLMADDYFKNNYVKKLSEHNDQYEEHKQKMEDSVASNSYNIPVTVVND